jgi:hypothetical protein
LAGPLVGYSRNSEKQSGDGELCQEIRYGKDRKDS